MKKLLLISAIFFSIASFGQCPESLDQQQSSGGGAGSGMDQWQSFTAGMTGKLTRVEFLKNGMQSFNVTFEIREGQGSGGNLLYSSVFSYISLGTGWNSFNIPFGSAPDVINGNQYTIRMVAATSIGWGANYSNLYAGGVYFSDVYGLQNDWDLMMKTYVTPLYQSPIIANLTANNPSCFGANDGSALVVGAGGTVAIDYSYAWSSGGTDAAEPNLVAGNYTVSITDDNGCTDTAQIIVTEPTAITGTVSEVAPISCSGGNDGILIVNATGGVGVLTYAWDSDQTTGITNSVGHSGYNGVEVEDQNGCVVNIGVYLTSPANIFATYTSTDMSCNGTCDGSISANVSGGTFPYTYLWNNDSFQITPTATGLCAGIDYIVEITDVNGCVFQETPTAMGLEIVEPDTLIVSFAITNSLCSAASGSAVASPSGGTLPYVSIVWSSGGNTLNESGLESGNYAFDIIDANGCLSSDTAYIGSDVIPVEVCVVTVDSSSTKNLIVWEKPITTGISHFNIYRDVVGSYTYVDNVPYDSLSQFVDNTAGVNPQITQYRYKVSVSDSCGNESDLSDFHQTIHLNAPNLVGNTADLVWQAYGGFSSNYYYRILRDSTGTNNWEVIDSVSSTTLVYTDIAVPNTSSISYLVQIAIPETCTAAKAQDHNTTRSNRAIIAGPNPNTINENTFNTLRVIPNPSTGMFTLHFDGQAVERNIEIYDVQGKKLVNKLCPKHNKTIGVDISEFETGVYLIKIVSDIEIKTARLLKQ